MTMLFVLKNRYCIKDTNLFSHRHSGHYECMTITAIRKTICVLFATLQLIYSRGFYIFHEISFVAIKFDTQVPVPVHLYGLDKKMVPPFL